MPQNIILITDTIPAANGGGISQTLYNLLDNWSGRISIITRPDEPTPTGPSLKADHLYWQFEKFKPWRNRFAKWINPLLNKLNFVSQEEREIYISNLPSCKDSFVLVSTTEPIKLHFAWLLHSKYGYKAVPYFMDDWLDGLQLSWKQRNIAEVAALLLLSAPCWLMISRQLENALVSRYRLLAKPSFIVHNPSPEFADQFKDENASKDEGQPTPNHTIIYAGSIWPMHLDALQLIAKAVSQLHVTNDETYQLKIYTSPAMWAQNKSVLEMPGVIYGGYVPYGNIQAKLSKGWMLLVTASFLSQWKAYSLSSVQTKITDYMAAGKPVLYVGKQDGASGVFVNEWDIGWCISQRDASTMALQLKEIADKKDEYACKSRRAKKLAQTNFSKPNVQQKLYDFLNTHIVEEA